MKRFKTGDYRSALRKKGFQSERSTKDEIYYLYVEGRKTSIFTKVSHGSSEDIRDPLLRMIKRQLNLNNSEVERFIDCPMEYVEYLENLKRKGIEP